MNVDTSASVIRRVHFRLLFESSYIYNVVEAKANINADIKNLTITPGPIC